MYYIATTCNSLEDIDAGSALGCVGSTVGNVGTTQLYLCIIRERIYINAVVGGSYRVKVQYTSGHVTVM